MPKRQKGQKRPADAVGASIMVAKIATGEEEDQTDPLPEIQSAKLIGLKR